MKISALFILVVLMACARQYHTDIPDDPVLARAYGNKLYLSEVTRIIPRNIQGTDSISMVSNYINKWVQKQIMIHNAKENLSPDEQDFTPQLEEYRNSLMLYKYERKLIDQYLDTLVSDDEILDYYRRNRDQFELKGNIVKFDYVKLPEKSRQLKDFRKLLKSKNLTDSVKLSDYCQKYSTDYWLAKDWVYLQDLLENMPLYPDNEENFLRRTKYTETSDDDFVYLLRINDYKTKDSIPPLDFEKDNIRNIIINSRKLDLLEKRRKQDIDEAFRNNEAEILEVEPIQ